MRLWCYDDSHLWGQTLAEVASRRGHDAKMFDDYAEPDHGFLFLSMHAHPAVREHHKRLMQHFATNPRLIMIPTYLQSLMFDDKLEQLRQLARYMPKTRLLRSPMKAREFMEGGPTFPIVSKSSLGGGVRFLQTIEEAHREVRLAFSDLGIKNRFGTKEHGFLYWQEFIESRDYIVRVVCVGNDQLLLKRGLRIRGQAERMYSPVTVFDAEALSAGDYAAALCERERLKFAVLDLIQYGESWRLLKMSVGWSMRKFAAARFHMSDYTGAEFWEVLVNQLESGAFGNADTV